MLRMLHDTSGERERSRSRMMHETSGRPQYYGEVRMLHETSGRRHRGPGPHNANCDNCQVKIEGPRYKCSVCVNFDFCSRCMDEYESQLCERQHTDEAFPRHMSHPLNNHVFQRISLAVTNRSPPAVQNRESWNHSGIQCNGCNTGRDIVGYRYFCTNCAISLCEACEQTGVHRLDHNLLKMVPPHIATDPLWQQGSNGGVRK